MDVPFVIAGLFFLYMGLFHKHTCEKCNTSWVHGNWNKGSVEAHTCPKCGGESWTRA
jgi:PHP family Zn ribbon phosphoesterase